MRDIPVASQEQQVVLWQPTKPQRHYGRRSTLIALEIESGLGRSHQGCELKRRASSDQLVRHVIHVTDTP